MSPVYACPGLPACLSQSGFKTVIHLLGLTKSAEVLLLSHRQGNAGCHPRSIGNRVDTPFMPVAPVPQRLLIGTPEQHRYLHTCLLHHAINGGPDTFSGAGIGPNQATGSKLDTTKIADNDHQYVAHILVLNHAQDGLASGSGRLTIIIHGSLGRRAGPADLIPPADMTGIGVVAVGLVNVCSYVVPVTDGIHSGNKTAFLHFRFPLKVPCRNRVILTHGRSYDDRRQRTDPTRDRGPCADT